MKPNPSNNTIEGIELALQTAMEASHIPTQKSIKQWLETAIALTPKSVPENQRQVTIRVIDREESQHLNEEYRHKMGPTNVLSFPPNKIPGFDLDTLGDLAICAPVVKDEAKAQNKTVEAHWAHMVIHGFLHLMGYDHIKEDEAKAMEGLESKIMQKLSFENPYSD